MLEKAWN